MMTLSSRSSWCLILLLVTPVTGKQSFGPLPAIRNPMTVKNNEPGSSSSSSSTSFLELRGGASRRKNKSARSASLTKKASAKTMTGRKKVGSTETKKSGMSELMAKYKRILPLTRMYISMVGICTLLGLALGDETSQALLTLDPFRTIYGAEIWRPFTAASFLGKPSIGWLMSGYYLLEYGSSLERAYGTAQYLIFLLSQVVILSIMSVLCGQPVFANSMITAMLHVLSRSMPNQKVKWLVFTVPYWSLPYGLMATDVLQAQSASAALPHILGILSGHFYHYHRFIWPKTGGEDWMSAPDFLISMMDPNARKNSAKDSLAKALKARKRGKGKKLGMK